MAATSERQLTQYEIRVKIRMKMDELLSSDRHKLLCGRCDTICNCQCTDCAALNDALADYLAQFQGSEQNSPPGITAIDQHHAVLQSVTTKFVNDQPLYGRFSNFVGRLWWLAAVSD